MSQNYQREIQDLKKQLELSQAEALKYKLIAEYANNWEFLMDRKGLFTYMSPSVKSFTGYTPESYLQDSDFFYEHIHQEDIQPLKNFIESCLDFSQLGGSINFRLFTRTRQPRHAELSMKAMYNQRGDYLGHRGSINDVTKLVEALGQIDRIDSVRRFEAASKDKYRDLASTKDRELTTLLLRMAHQSELLQHVKNQLEKMPSSEPEVKGIKSNLLRKISHDELMKGQWEEFQIYFEKSHPGFFQRLSEQFPNLTSKDLKICAYLRLQLNTKEIAELLNITPESAQVSRVRLRKKLSLRRKENLTVFLNRV